MTLADQISAIMSQYGEELLAIGAQYTAAIEKIKSSEKDILPHISKACERAKNKVNILAHSSRKQIDDLHATMTEQIRSSPRTEAVDALVSASKSAKQKKKKKLACLKSAHTENSNG